MSGASGDDNDDAMFLLIEPRNHAATPFVLGSFMGRYPGWPCHWYHGTETDTERVLRDPRVAPHRHNVVLHGLPKANLTIADYNALFFSADFWRDQPRELVWVIQTDVALFHDSPHDLREFHCYDYCGAPWPHARVAQLGPWEWSGRAGNGGFSFRRRAAMVRCLEEGPAPADNEDVFFAYHCRHLIRVAPGRVAARMSCEMAKTYPNPAGAHKGHVYEPRIARDHPEARVLGTLQRTV